MRPPPSHSTYSVPTYMVVFSFVFPDLRVGLPDQSSLLHVHHGILLAESNRGFTCSSHSDTASSQRIQPAT
jgi:hypothetical protein